MTPIRRHLVIDAAILKVANHGSAVVTGEQAARGTTVDVRLDESYGVVVIERDGRNAGDAAPVSGRSRRRDRNQTIVVRALLGGTPVKRAILALAAVALSLLGAGGAPVSAAAGDPRCPLPTFGPGSAYHPNFRAAGSTAHVTNPWFPLPVGRTYVYTGVDGKHRTTDIVTVSTRTKMIDGVRTREVNDRVLIGGLVRERTTDYYAQDACGNVWYFGEDTAELDALGRVVTTEGSFRAGVDGAQPGLFMQAHPQLGRKFRQEWYQGQAEDVFKALSTTTTRTVPYGTFTGVLRTLETNALEPGVRDNKYYAPDIGTISELTVRGGKERLSLVDVLH